MKAAKYLYQTLTFNNENTDNSSFTDVSIVVIPIFINYLQSTNTSPLIPPSQELFTINEFNAILKSNEMFKLNNSNGLGYETTLTPFSTINDFTANSSNKSFRYKRKNNVNFIIS